MMYFRYSFLLGFAFLKTTQAATASEALNIELSKHSMWFGSFSCAAAHSFFHRAERFFVQDSTLPPVSKRSTLCCFTFVRKDPANASFSSLGTVRIHCSSPSVQKILMISWEALLYRSRISIMPNCRSSSFVSFRRFVFRR